MKSQKRSHLSTHGPKTGVGEGREGVEGPASLTIGVEEEYLLVDPVSRQVSPEADKVVTEAAIELGASVTTEITRCQVEIRTDPHTSLADLGDQLRAARHAVARAASRFGLRIISSGTPVLGQDTPVPLTPGPRYAKSAAMFRALDEEQSACACHVHLGVPDLTTALGLSNHLRPWLPALIALTANSPYWAGRDTGYASWRTMTWWRWPVAGPPPHFASRAHFDDLVEGLITSGTVMDRGGLYWDIRPSHHVPTLEVRVADASPTVEDTLLLAAVLKGLATRALEAVRQARPAPRPQPEMLRAACWRAARDGLSGQAVNPHTGRLAPASAQLDQLLDAVRPALTAAGDLPTLQSAEALLRAQGNGADRQRAAHQHGRDLNDVVDHLIRTAATPRD